MMADINSGRATRQSPRGEMARRAILKSATKLFSAGGYYSASLADIAADVGMTQAGLLHHFSSKAGLLLAVLQERDERTARDEDAGLARGLDFLTVFLQTLHENEKTPALVQLFAVLSAESITNEHPANGWFVARYRKIVGQMTQVLDDLVDPQALPSGVTAETIARWLIAAADGLRLQWLLDPEAELDRHKSIAQLIDLLRPYLREPMRSFSWLEHVDDEGRA